MEKECEICGRTFIGHHALGGHMRNHQLKGEGRNKGKAVIVAPAVKKQRSKRNRRSIADMKEFLSKNLQIIPGSTMDQGAAHDDDDAAMSLLMLSKEETPKKFRSINEMTTTAPSVSSKQFKSDPALGGHSGGGFMIDLNMPPPEEGEIQRGLMIDLNMSPPEEDEENKGFN